MNAKVKNLEKRVLAGKLDVSEAVEKIIVENLERFLPVSEDYAEVVSIGTHGQHCNYGDFSSTGEIIDWSYQRANFYKKAKENKDGELEVKIYHSDYIYFNGEHFEKINLYEILKETDL